MAINKISNKRAEEFLQENFSSPTHWPDWNLLVAKYYDTNFFYLGYFEKKKLTGICPYHETIYKKILSKRYSGQFHLIPNGSWIFSKPIKISKGFFATDRHLFAHSQIFTLPNVPEFNANYHKIQSTKKKTLIIDLKQDEEEIWKSDINSKRRNMVRKAAKKGVYIKSIDNKTDLMKFYELYETASKSFSVRQLSYEFIKDMFFKSQNISLDIFVAYKKSEQIANVGIVSDKNYSYYWLGNNAKNTKNLGQGELLQWEAIKFMRNKGCKYYDLCYIEPERLPGIYNFKKGFSKDIFDIYLINHKPLAFKLLNRFIS